MSPAAPLVSPLQLAGAALQIAAIPALLLVLGGDARWLQGWLFAAWFVSLCATVVTWLYLRDPALLAERFRSPGTGGQKGWDLVAVAGIAVSFVAWLVVMPLDARRFHWTPLPPALEVAGGVLLLGAAFFLFRALHDNTFASPLVRMQTERAQRVVSTGVYGFVRHPMYLGAVLMSVGAPLLLGSALGLAAALALSLVLAARIVGEERMLARELEGYAEYRQKVRYRLLPGVW